MADYYSYYAANNYLAHHGGYALAKKFTDDNYKRIADKNKKR